METLGHTQINLKQDTLLTCYHTYRLFQWAAGSSSILQCNSCLAYFGELGHVKHAQKGFVAFSRMSCYLVPMPLWPS